MSRRSVISYKAFSASLIQLGVPVKTTIQGTYKSDVRPVISIQTPVVIFNPNTGNISCKLTGNGEFVNFLESIEKYIVYTLNEKSEEFFNNRKFSEDIIKQRLKLYNIVDDSVIVFTRLSDNLKVLDSFNHPVITRLDDDQDCHTILQFESLHYTGVTITPIINITHIKLPFKKIQKRFNLEIDTDDSDNDDTPNTDDYTGYSIEVRSEGSIDPLDEIENVNCPTEIKLPEPDISEINFFEETIS